METMKNNAKKKHAMKNVQEKKTYKNNKTQHLGTYVNIFKY